MEETTPLPTRSPTEQQATANTPQPDKTVNTTKLPGEGWKIENTTRRIRFIEEVYRPEQPATQPTPMFGIFGETQTKPAAQPRASLDSEVPWGSESKDAASNPDSNGVRMLPGVYIPVQAAYPRFGAGNNPSVIRDAQIKPWENYVGPDKAWELEFGIEYTTLSYEEIQLRNAKVVVTDGPTVIPYRTDQMITCYSCSYCDSTVGGSATQDCPAGFGCFRFDWAGTGSAWRGCAPGCVNMGTLFTCCFRDTCNGAQLNAAISTLTLAVTLIASKLL